MTEVDLSGTHDLVPRLRWHGELTLALAALALACSLIVLGNRLAPLGPWWPWWQFIRIAGCVGFWLACLAMAGGLAVRIAAVRLGAPEWRGLVTLMLSAVALGITCLGVALYHQPVYWLHGIKEPSTAQLNALSPEGVVRTYFTSQDLSVQYRLLDSAGRSSMASQNTARDLSLLAGVDGLRLTSLDNTAHRADARHRSFVVTYTSRAPDDTGAEPGPQQRAVDVVRKPGGPWRISCIASGI